MTSMRREARQIYSLLQCKEFVNNLFDFTAYCDSCEILAM
jgi:hypothetical protein